MQSVSLSEQAYQHLVKGDYSQAAALYEQATQLEPDQAEHYWYLGIALLFDGDESAAQATWFTPLLTEATERHGLEENILTIALVTVLDQEASRLEGSQKELAWLLRRYAQEFAPDNLSNGLKLLKLALEREDFSWSLPEVQLVLELLQKSLDADLDLKLLQIPLKIALGQFYLESGSYEFAQLCARYTEQLPEFSDLLQRTAGKVGWGHYQYPLGAKYAELGRQIDPQNVWPLRVLADFYERMQQYDRAIAAAEDLCNLSSSLADQCYANHLLIQTLIAAGGYWQKVQEKLALQWQLLATLLVDSPSLLRFQVRSLFILAYTPPYLEDNPSFRKPILNRLMQLCQDNIASYAREHYETYRQNQKHRSQKILTDRPLKIGYLSDNLRRHAIGWLAWGLYEYCDRENFQLYTYFTGNLAIDADHWRLWYAQHSKQYCIGNLNSYSLADQIDQDEIDILVDLDSVTLDINCEVLALKPAPIQVSWLGFDGSGLPAVDYYIVDPYVLPEQAQAYYSETLWRLPQTYLAVNGFLVGSPTLRREDLGIPADAVIYLSSQRAAKRNPHLTQLQMQILQEMPNSYLLIKGFANQKSLQVWFEQIAAEAGVSSDRLRFVPSCPSDEQHRANLRIADVVLDTYPYNGATTTLETLWMEIPLVTRVGEQFAARNSYTFLVNAGVEEGIAWSDAEYVEWGVRLGKEPELRDRVALKLRAAKKNSPLWNARQFTHHMEAAYQQMWQIYQQSR
uniref:protein O-GlcNAc transferase n=1 Tax=Cyanothece sp. (strain PCC 7425 / ATCC 29141) TaxID=395961 RepID=B8HX17_CYAP4